MKNCIYLFFLLICINVNAENKQAWVDFCAQEKAILSNIPAANKSAIAEDVLWLGGQSRLININGESIDLLQWSDRLKNKEYTSSLLPTGKETIIRVEVVRERIDDIFSYLVDTPSNDQVFGYLRDDILKHSAEEIRKIATTSAAFSVLASYISVESITCLETNKNKDLELFALLRFKQIPKEYEFYKRFKSQSLQGLVIGFNLNKQKVIEAIYEINSNFSVKVTYISSVDFNLGTDGLLKQFLGWKNSVSVEPTTG